jgi:hypothetical protein
MHHLELRAATDVDAAVRRCLREAWVAAGPAAGWTAGHRWPCRGSGRAAMLYRMAPVGMAAHVHLR